MTNTRVKWTGICLDKKAGAHAPAKPIAYTMNEVKMKRYETLDIEIVTIVDIITTSNPKEDYEGEIDWRH